MREAIGGTVIFQIVIFFILLFAGFMCLSINYSKAFNVKNMIINTLEREEDVNLYNPKNDNAIKEIVEYLKKASYRTTGKCSTGYQGYNRDGNIDSNNSAFCLKMEDTGGGELPRMAYYRVEVFYQLDLPIFRSIFQFKVRGDTKILSRTVNGYSKIENGTWVIN